MAIPAHRYNDTSLASHCSVFGRLRCTRLVRIVVKYHARDHLNQENKMATGVLNISHSSPVHCQLFVCMIGFTSLCMCGD